MSRSQPAHTGDVALPRSNGRNLASPTARVILALAVALGLTSCAMPLRVNEAPSLPGLPTPAPPPATAAPVPERASTDGRLEVTLTAAETQVPYAGATRWAMAYNGLVTGPTLRVRPGDTLAVTLVNRLDSPTSLHTHGLHVPPEVDDPFLTVAPGQSHTYTYAIPADQLTGTYWYHPHVHERSAEQVASGLSGAIVVADATDDALARVSTDRVLVVNDPPLVSANPWGPGGADHGGMMGHGSSGVDMMTAMVGRTGPRLLTNGQDGVVLEPDGDRLERVRVVNATASTRLVLGFEGARMLALSSGGGRLPHPREVSSVDLAPGDRAELVLVPGPDGGRLVARRTSNEGGGALTGAPEVVATVSASAGTDTAVLPATMGADSRDLFAPGVQVARQRVITLDGHMRPRINGALFDPARVDLTATSGTVEEWVIRNASPMLHPIHLHTWPFQVRGQQGWADVVTVPADGEQVIRVAFDDITGTTVLHCHILDHEDTGMMAVIRVA